jgi:hypothetical protein
MRVMLLIAMISGLIVRSEKPSRADIQETGTMGTTFYASGIFTVRNWVASGGPTPVVLSRRDIVVADGTSTWTSHGAGTAPVQSEGLAAVWYAAGTDFHELIVYVGTDGNINRGEIVNGGPIGWTSIAPPTGKTLTGYLAIGTFSFSGNRHLVIAATTTDNKLYRYVNIVGSTGT